MNTVDKGPPGAVSVDKPPVPRASIADVWRVPLAVWRARKALDRGDLVDYRLAHAARAELCRRLGRTADARASYERALALTRQEPERRFLDRRLGEL